MTMTLLPLSYAARHLLRDPVRLLQKALGATFVVFLVMAASAFNHGMEAVLSGTGSEHNVILLGAGSEESVERSSVSVQSESLAASGIRGVAVRLGATAISGEVHYMGQVTVGDHPSEQALLRGVTPSAFEVHRQVRVLEGRYPHSGELLVGRLAHHALGLKPPELQVGATVRFEDQNYKVSGIFEAPGTVMESELWFNRQDLMIAVQRDALSCLILRMDHVDGFKDVDLFCRQRLDLELVAILETEYYGKLAGFYGPLRTMTWLTAALVAAGSIFGGINLLYAAFSSRIRELATLQAIGFQRISIMISLIQESLISAVIGTLAAAWLATLILDGVNVPFSMGTFSMSLSPSILLQGLIMGLCLGIFGALPPAWRCLSASLPKALRSA
jgi:putative ABC transport system permease protein